MALMQGRACLSGSKCIKIGGSLIEIFYWGVLYYENLNELVATFNAHPIEHRDALFFVNLNGAVSTECHKRICEMNM